MVPRRFAGGAGRAPLDFGERKGLFGHGGMMPSQTGGSALSWEAKVET